MVRESNSLGGYYDEDFYQNLTEGSLNSARKYVALLSRVFSPKSVLDIGCGRGAWLKAFSERGAGRLVGIDGHWNSQQSMLDESIEFIECDLERVPLIHERFDLSLSLEVGEHLSMSASDRLVSALCSASSVIVFSAAIPGQGGRNHINEQPQSFWASKFLSRGYTAFDFFRPKFWEDEDVEVWYRQNTFLYVRDSALQSGCKERLECCRVLSLAFMDVRHPDRTGIKVRLSDLGNAVRKRLSRGEAR